MRLPRHWSIRWKLTHIAMMTATAALVLAMTGIAVFEYFSLRQHVRGEQQMLANVVAGNSTAAITFNRADDAAATLATLSAHSGIRGACIYDGAGKILATYQAKGEDDMHFAPHPDGPGFRFSSEFLEIHEPVMLDGKVIGTVFLRSDLCELYDRLKLYASVSPLILLASWGLALLLASGLQRYVSKPIVTLAETSRRVSQEGDYMLRAPKFGDDELGGLADAFNHMLEGICQRDAQINHHLQEVKTARDQLESRVEERTGDLKRANADLQAEMVHRQEAERKRQEMQTNLVEASRRAGMADVATGVLHNVGNVLNSINVSTQIVHDAVKSSRVSSLAKASELLREHSEDLPAFLTSDARGKSLPAFFYKLTQALTQENSMLLKEVDGLASNIAHIREIVAMQQSFSRVAHVESSVTIGELIEDAIKINIAGLNRHGVVIERDFDASMELMVDRHKVLQILINLISNAKYAVNGAQESARRVTLRATVAADGKQLIIQVIDNGVGIDPKQMTRIFAYGFTTKKEGHGFGLHSSALAAKEIGGSLDAFSKGLGQGATFTLKVPFSKEAAHAG